jgi:hypothetical protein
MDAGRAQSVALAAFFSGVPLFLCVVLVAYAMAYLADTISCFNASQYILTPEELEECRTASSVTRQSGLAGILSLKKFKSFDPFSKNALICTIRKRRRRMTMTMT